MGAFPGEKVLLGEAGGGAEVGAAEMGDLSGRPASELVAPGHGFDHPRVDGEGFELTGAKEEHAVGDFFADAGEREEAGFGLDVGQCGGLVQPTGVRGQKLGGAGDILRLRESWPVVPRWEGRFLKS